LRPTGNVGIMGDPRNSSSDTREFVCDKCGQRKVGVIITDPVTECVSEHSKELAQFKGKYVAIQDVAHKIQVIASGSYEQVMTTVKNDFPNVEPVIMKVPARGPAI
jgi:hypothetical protein